MIVENGIENGNTLKRIQPKRRVKVNLNYRNDLYDLSKSDLDAEYCFIISSRKQNLESKKNLSRKRALPTCIAVNVNIFPNFYFSNFVWQVSFDFFER